jgi:hypothetical protein
MGWRPQWRGSFLVVLIVLVLVVVLERPFSTAEDEDDYSVPR